MSLTNEKLSQTRKLYGSGVSYTFTNDTTLLAACETLNIGLIEGLLQDRADPNAVRVRVKKQQGLGKRPEPKRESALDVALKASTILKESNVDNILKLLIQHNADVRKISGNTKKYNITSPYLDLGYFIVSKIQHCLKYKSPSLDLSGCGIENLSDYFPDNSFAKFSSFLRTLDISNNRIAVLPYSIRCLENLEELVLTDNDVHDLSPLASMIHIRTLDLNGNPLSSIPYNVVRGGASEILKYLHILWETGTEYNIDSKLIVVGQENVGKTALISNIAKGYVMKHLQDSDSNFRRFATGNSTISTHGIDTLSFSLKGELTTTQQPTSPFVNDKTGTWKKLPFHVRRTSLPKFKAITTFTDSSNNSGDLQMPLTKCYSTPVVENESTAQYSPKSRSMSLSMPINDINFEFSSSFESRPRSDNIAKSNAFVNAKIETNLENQLRMPIKDFVQRLIAPKTGLTLRSNKWHMKTYKCSFTGNQFVNWCHQNTSLSKDDAVLLGELLIKKQIIERETFNQPFRDSTVPYRFSKKALKKSDLVKYRFHAYDFAGQEIYYPSHQLFFSSEAIYFIVFDLSKSFQESRIEFWLNTVQSRVRDNAQVFLVGTHSDIPYYQDVSASQIIEQLQSEYLPRFDFIKGIFFVSNKSLDGISDLQQILVKTAQQVLNKNPLVPLKYKQLSENLNQDRAQLVPILTWNHVQEKGKLLNMTEEEIISAIEFLHQKGVLLHVSSVGAKYSSIDNQPELEHLLVTNPDWLSKALGNIIGSGANSSFAKNGILREADLHHVWKSPHYPPSIHQQLLQILQHLELIFCLPNQLILLPTLLPEKCVNFSLWSIQEPELVRVIEYSHFPNELFSRIIVQLFSLQTLHRANQLAYYKFGISIGFASGVRVLVQYHPEKRSLVIRVRGMDIAENLAVEMFHRVLDMIKHLSTYWYHLKFEWFVPCTQCVIDSPTRESDQTQEYYVDTSKIFMISQTQFLSTQSSVEIECNLSQHKCTYRLDWVLPYLGLLQGNESFLIYDHLLIEKKLIATGLNGRVYSAKYRNEFVAVKEFTAATIQNSERIFQEFCSEVRFLCELSHPSIIKCFGFSLDPNAMVVMEFCEFGDLHNFIGKHKPLSWRMRLRCMNNIAGGISYLHAQTPPVVHRDLKSPNILICSSNPKDKIVAKISDFGLSMSLWNPIREETHDRDVHTATWLAPEVMSSFAYSEKVDCYALGIIMWELLACNHPFEEFNFKFNSALEEAIISGLRPSIPALPEDQAKNAIVRHIYNRYTNLLRKCWDNSPNARPSAKEIYDTCEELESMLSPLDALLCNE